MQPHRRPPEVELLGDCNEVAQLPQLDRGLHVHRSWPNLELVPHTGPATGCTSTQPQAGCENARRSNARGQLRHASSNYPLNNARAGTDEGVIPVPVLLERDPVGVSADRRADRSTTHVLWGRPVTPGPRRVRTVSTAQPRRSVRLHGNRWVDLFDAGGLSLFCVTGATVALKHGLGPFQAIILGGSLGWAEAHCATSSYVACRPCSPVGCTPFPRLREPRSPCWPGSSSATASPPHSWPRPCASLSASP